MPSSHLILCCPILLLPPIPPSIKVFSSESALRMRWPKYWSFSFSIRSVQFSSVAQSCPTLCDPMNLKSFWWTLKMNTQDWSPLGWNSWISLQSKGLKSLLQHHSSKESILWCSAFFIIQLSHPHMATGKTIALTRRTFVVKVMSLLFNILSNLVAYRIQFLFFRQIFFK